MLDQQNETQEINFSPLSQTISPILAMRGPSLAKPGDRLAITDRYNAWGRKWLLLTHSSTRHTQEVAIKYVSKRHEGVIVALAPIHMIFDPGDMTEMELTLAEVTNYNFLRLLSRDEIDALFPHLQAEVVGRRIWPIKKQVLTLEADIQETLGPFRNK